MWQLRLGKISEYRRDKRYLCKDGHSLWADVSTTLIRDQRGLPLRTVSVIQDITSVKLAADAHARVRGSSRQCRSKPAVSHRPFLSRVVRHGEKRIA